MKPIQKAILALEDGTVFEGRSFGFPGEKAGELVFNTSMTGYQEILTDPSYKGQIVIMTYPLIGNYGINEADVESRDPKVEAFVIKENSSIYSNWRADRSLSDYLITHRIMGVEGMDTRALTKHIRQKGAMKAILSTEDLDRDRLIEKAKASPGLIGRDLVKEVTCGKPYEWTEANDAQFLSHPLPPSVPRSRFKVAVMDFGVKLNILRSLRDWGCEVTVLPASAAAESVLSLNPDGILLSNGPGDPEGVPYAIESVRKLIGEKPIFGICLGHQLLGLALGGKTFKLKFGHRGGNQPVKDLQTGKVHITSQNHGFAVAPDSLNPEEVELTQINLNDRTLEGMRHKKLPVFSVQYHPEASPGPQDTQSLFGEFVKMMEEEATEK
jgi:carbamoyl-phosphate synthase small subunit